MLVLPYTDSGATDPIPGRGKEEVVHPVSTTPLLALTHAPGSSQVVPRHPKAIAYRCFLPDLTGFTAQNARACFNSPPTYQRMTFEISSAAFGS